MNGRPLRRMNSGSCARSFAAGSGDPKLTDFLDQWVYDTGMPTLRLTYSVAGRKLTGTVTQTDAREISA